MGVLSRALGLSGGGVVSLVGAGGKTTLMFRLARELDCSGAFVLTSTTTKVQFPASDKARHIFLAPDGESVLKEARRIMPQQGVVFAAKKKHPRHQKLVGFSPEAVDFLAAAGVFQWILVEADGAARKPAKAPASHEPVIPAASRWVVAVLGLDAVGCALNDNGVFRARRFAKITGLSLGQSVSAASLAKVLVHPQGILKGCPEHALTAAFLNKADTPERVSHGRAVIHALQAIRSPILHRVVVGRLLPEVEIHETCELKKREKAS